MECPECEGKGCEECAKTGKMELTECPLAFAGSEVWAVIEAAALFKHGLAPVHGGMLDQAATFIDAARFIWAEQSWCRAKLGIPSGDSD